jgi:UDP-galactopyranose mutase
VWIAERVAVVDVDAILRNVVLGEDHLSWGPNSTFKYPLRGGTGSLYDGLRPFVEEHLELRSPVRAVDPHERVVTTADGRRFPYDVLLSTMPLNRLVECVEGVPGTVARAAAHGLHWSGSHIVGVGIDRPAGTTKNWVYYPEPDVPFYRLTYLSNYSPYMTAEPGQTLLLTETSRSPHKPDDAATVVDRTIAGLRRVGVLDDGDRIVTTWLGSPDMSYPVPSTTRDVALGIVQPWLRAQGIASRGRFGAWLYEIGNMDHSCMQGVEWVDHVLFDAPETTWIPRGEDRASAD